MELTKIFKEYDRVLKAAEGGYINKATKDFKLTELYEMSGYDNVFDFYLAFLRWKNNIPEQLTLF